MIIILYLFHVHMHALQAYMSFNITMDLSTLLIVHHCPYIYVYVYKSDYLTHCMHLSIMSIYMLSLTGGLI